jgi:cobalt/nickel transport system permease protein
MHTLSLDRYQHRNSHIHRLDPRVKVVTTVLFILSNALLPDGAWLAFGLSWVALLLCNQLANMGLGYTLRRSFVALPFALAAVTAIFTLPGRPVGALSLGTLQLVATDAGITRFISIVVRSWLSVQMAILLAGTTRFPDLMHALRHLRVPSIMVAIVSFMYRYLAVLVDETTRLLRARDARSARQETGHGGTVMWRARVAGNMAGQLFLRSYERSDRIYNAMLARGFRGEFHSLNPHVMRQSDWNVLAIAAVAILLQQVVARLSL